MFKWEDSVVRGTPMKDVSSLLSFHGAEEVHLRSASPPILFHCKYLNFSPSSFKADLITRRIIEKLEGKCSADLGEYADSTSEKYNYPLTT